MARPRRYKITKGDEWGEPVIEVRGEDGKVLGQFDTREDAKAFITELRETGPEDESFKAHSLDITRELKDAAMQGQPLFQGDEKTVRGMTQFAEDGTAIMHLFEKANFSTFAHESFHIMRRYLKPEDTAVLEKALKVKDGAWTTAAEEKAARTWERYLRDGIAPNAELKTLFAKVAAWMRSVYEKLKGGHRLMSRSVPK